MQAGPQVGILAPSSGAVLGGPSVRLVLEVGGITIAPVAQQRPGAAHVHLFLDVDPTPLGQPIPVGAPGITHLGGGQLEYTLDSLRNGRHRVIVVLGDNAHVAIAGQTTDTVTFTVVSHGGH
jgi:hypothetical protein